MEKLTLVKVGGKIVEDELFLKQLLIDFTSIDGYKVLVHGGGRMATTIGNRLGIESKYIDGRRITDEETLKVVTMVYGGLVNKNIVANLQAIGCNAIGLTGADLNLIEAHKRPVKEIDYGFAGDVDKVNADLLKILISKGVVPVVAPLTHNLKGQMLNTNADTIASELAVALSGDFEVSLVFCFKKKGVLKDENNDDIVISSLNFSEYQSFKEDAIITGGMIQKLDNAFRCIEKGVSSVIIKRADMLNKNEGTVIA